MDRDAYNDSVDRVKRWIDVGKSVRDHEYLTEPNKFTLAEDINYIIDFTKWLDECYNSGASHI